VTQVAGSCNPTNLPRVYNSRRIDLAEGPRRPVAVAAAQEGRSQVPGFPWKWAKIPPRNLAGRRLSCDSCPVPSRWPLRGQRFILRELYIPNLPRSTTAHLLSPSSGGRRRRQLKGTAASPSNARCQAPVRSPGLSPRRRAVNERSLMEPLHRPQRLRPPWRSACLSAVDISVY